MNMYMTSLCHLGNCILKEKIKKYEQFVLDLNQQRHTLQKEKNKILQNN